MTNPQDDFNSPRLQRAKIRVEDDFAITEKDEFLRDNIQILRLGVWENSVAIDLQGEQQEKQILLTADGCVVNHSLHRLEPLLIVRVRFSQEACWFQECMCFEDGDYLCAILEIFSWHTSFHIRGDWKRGSFIQGSIGLQQRDQPFNLLGQFCNREVDQGVPEVTVSVNAFDGQFHRHSPMESPRPELR